MQQEIRRPYFNPTFLSVSAFSIAASCLLPSEAACCTYQDKLAIANNSFFSYK
ncbi:MAG: hypothetical protein PUP93_13715 [Rhizonema sp. NSF051]|nr:hypothetical protein [Rhizonema sp. NSF051]